MRRAAWIAGMTVAAVSLMAGPVTAQSEGTRGLALELARLTVDDAARKRVDEQIISGLVRTMAGTLQQRLNRRLVDVEWQMLGEIVTRFVRQTLPRHRADELTAEVYLRHFDEAELRELVAFQSSPVGRKAARLLPTLAIDTTRAIDAELRASPAVADVLVELRRAFPILGGVESP